MRQVISIVSFAASAALVIASHADEPHAARRSRTDFAAAMNRVAEGMPEKQILELLGEPDDKRTEHDARGILTARTREIWRYGTSGHLAPATLGQIYIDEQGLAQYIYGQGTPRADDSIPEEELRRLLKILAEVPSYNSGSRFNPVKVIRAVNELQPLGKQRALSVIDEHLRIISFFDDDSREGVFLLLRALFEVPSPPGYMPEMRVGAPDPPEPENKRLLPRFPITLEDDIPLLLVYGYLLASEPEQPESHVEYFRAHGTLRAQPLRPSATPFASLDALAKSKRWPFNENDAGPESRGRLQLSEQILRMLDTVYRIEPKRLDELLPWDSEDTGKRRRILADAAALKIRWDAAKNEYTFLDGTTLPPRKIVHYRRETWKPEVVDLNVECVVERRSPVWVEVSVRASFATEKCRRAFTARVYRLSHPKETLARFDQGAYLAYDVIRMDEGTEMQLEFKIDGRTLVSPKFQP